MDVGIVSDCIRQALLSQWMSVKSISVRVIHHRCYSNSAPLPGYR